MSTTPYDLSRLAGLLDIRHDWQLAADEVWADHGMFAAIVFMLGA